MGTGVGVAGYTLGGGIGWLARREGFAASHVRGFEVVGADGKARRVDAESDPDLFWALRGGGGRQVIVTAFELELFELREAYGGALMWAIEQAESVVHAYREWIATVPNSLTSTIKQVRFPPLPTVADALRGKTLVSITLVFCGTEEQGEELVSPLRDAAPTYMDTLATVPGRDLGEIAGDPTDPLPALGHAQLLDRFSSDVADAYLALGGPEADTPLTSLEIRHLGGALRTADPDPGAAGPLDAEALIYGTAAATTADSAKGISAALGEVGERMAPFTGTRKSILTFAERPPLGDSFTPEVAARLETITTAHDPDGLLVANHITG
jgi:hypothetical protein